MPLINQDIIKLMIKKIKSQITKNYNIALNYYNELKKYENHKEEYK